MLSVKPVEKAVPAWVPAAVAPLVSIPLKAFVAMLFGEHCAGSRPDCYNTGDGLNPGNTAAYSGNTPACRGDH